MQQSDYPSPSHSALPIPNGAGFPSPNGSQTVGRHTSPRSGIPVYTDRGANSPHSGPIFGYVRPRARARNAPDGSESSDHQLVLGPSGAETGTASGAVPGAVVGAEFGGPLDAVSRKLETTSLHAHDYGESSHETSQDSFDFGVSPARKRFNHASFGTIPTRSEKRGNGSQVNAGSKSSQANSTTSTAILSNTSNISNAATTNHANPTVSISGPRRSESDTRRDAPWRLPPPERRRPSLMPQKSSESQKSGKRPTETRKPSANHKPSMSRKPSGNRKPSIDRKPSMNRKHSDRSIGSTSTQSSQGSQGPPNEGHQAGTSGAKANTRHLSANRPGMRRQNSRRSRNSHSRNSQNSNRSAAATNPQLDTQSGSKAQQTEPGSVGGAKDQKKRPKPLNLSKTTTAQHQQFNESRSEPTSGKQAFKKMPAHQPEPVTAPAFGSKDGRGRTKNRQNGFNKILSGLPLDLSLPGTPTNESRPSSSRSLSATTKRIFSALRGSSSRMSMHSNGSHHRSPSLSRPGTSLSVIEEPALPVWPEPAGRAPPAEVKAALEPLTQIPTPLVDIEPTARTVPIDPRHAAVADQELSDFERAEVLQYRAVHFTGAPGTKLAKRQGQFADGEGNYKHMVQDHIGYRYRIESELGVGSFGKVLKCRDHKSGRMVAVKVTANRKELRQQAKVEANLLKKLVESGSPDQFHFVRYVEHFVFREHMCIVTEMLGPNLYEVLKRNQYRGLPLDAVRFITRQVCEGLEFLDAQGIIHCDLKPENILVSNVDQCQVKIIDFGSGCHESRRVYTYIQSRFYRAPEILLGIPYSPAIDMWSLGCIVPELLVGRPLFPGEDEKDQIALLCETLGSPEPAVLARCSRGKLFFDAQCRPLSLVSPKGTRRGLPGSKSLHQLIPHDAADFVLQLLEFSPRKRLSAAGAVFHEFLLGV